MDQPLILPELAGVITSPACGWLYRGLIDRHLSIIEHFYQDLAERHRPAIDRDAFAPEIQLRFTIAGLVPR